MFVGCNRKTSCHLDSPLISIYTVITIFEGFTSCDGIMVHLDLSFWIEIGFRILRLHFLVIRPVTILSFGCEAVTSLLRFRGSLKALLVLGYIQTQGLK